MATPSLDFRLLAEDCWGFGADVMSIGLYAGISTWVRIREFDVDWGVVTGCEVLSGVCVGCLVVFC